MQLFGGRGVVSDRPTVEVQVYAATYAQAQSLSERICEWLCGPPPPIPQLDKVTCDGGPREIPYGDIRIRRFVTSYQLTTRRVPAA